VHKTGNAAGTDRSGSANVVNDDTIKMAKPFTLFDEQTYISCVVIFDYPSYTDKYLGNVFAQCFRQPGENWRLNVIQRTYVDDKIYSSDDRKQYFSREFPADTPEAEVVADIDDTMRGLCKVLDGEGYTLLKVHGDVGKWLEVCKLDPRLHVGQLPKEEEEET